MLSKSFFESALKYGREAMKPVQALTATYEPQGGAPFTFLVVPGLATSEIETNDGLVVSRIERDFLVEKEDLKALGRDPQRGDVIKLNGESFKVSNTAGAREWDWHGCYQDAYRIHVQQVKHGV